MSTPVVDPGSQKPPAAPSAEPQRPAPRPNGAPVKGGGLEAIKIKVGGRAVKYPIQMKVNISPARVHRTRRRMKDDIGRTHAVRPAGKGEVVERGAPQNGRCYVESAAP